MFCIDRMKPIIFYSSSQLAISLFFWVLANVLVLKNNVLISHSKSIVVHTKATVMAAFAISNQDIGYISHNAKNVNTAPVITIIVERIPIAIFITQKF